MNELLLRLSVEDLLNHTAALRDEVDHVYIVQKDLGKIVGQLVARVATVSASLTSQTAALQASLELQVANQPMREADPVPVSVLSSVVAALTSILKRIDQLQNQIDAMDRRTSAGSTITFDSYGQPSKIQRDNGETFVIQRDLNRRTIRFQPRN